MRRGEIYRTRDRPAERGSKPGFYVVVSRTFIAENEDVSTVICAPVYSEILGLSTEVVISQADGVPRASAIRCDFLCLMFKDKLTSYTTMLSEEKIVELDGALTVALDIQRHRTAEAGNP
jgi:mRNA interferase MazF